MGADMPTNVFDLASRQASWLLAKQALVAQNVANANRPGYQALDLKPFESSLQTAQVELAITSPGHINAGGSQAEIAAEDSAADDGEISLSGNNVSQEQEMMKSGAIVRAYALNTSVVKAFNSMLLQAARG